MTAGRGENEGPRVFPPPAEGRVALFALLEAEGISWDELTPEDQAQLLAAADAASED